MRIAAFVLVAILGVTTAQKQKQVFDAGNGVSLPVVVKKVRPHYTPTAMAANIQGTMLLNAVVLDDGRVGDVDVVIPTIRNLTGRPLTHSSMAVQAWDAGRETRRRQNCL